MPCLALSKLCVTNMSREERDEIGAIARDNGANFDTMLSRDTTHLLTTQKVGKKVDFARAHGVAIVHPKWLHESIIRGAMLDAALFDPTLADDQLGVGAYDRKQLERCRARALRQQKPSTMQDSTASARFEDSIVVTKRRRLNSAVKHSAPINEVAAILSHDRTLHSSEADGLSVELHLEDDVQANSKQLFSGKSFVLHGFAEGKTRVIESHIVKHGGFVLPALKDLKGANLTNLKTFVVVPHDVPRSKAPAVPTGVCVATDWWLEQCLQNMLWRDPTEYAFGVPFMPDKVPILGFEKFGITCTALSGVEHLHMAQVIKLLGAKYYDTLKRGRSVLIVGDNKRSELRQKKIERAIDWRTRVCSAQWIYEIARREKLVHLAPYAIDGKNKQGVIMDASVSNESTKLRTLGNGVEELAVRSRSATNGSDSDTRGNMFEIPNSARSEEAIPLSAIPTTSPKLNKHYLQGCRIAICDDGSGPQDTRHELERLVLIVKNHGGELVARENTTKSHLVVVDTQLDQVDDACHVVTKDWLLKCSTSGKRVSEQAYLLRPLGHEEVSLVQLHKRTSSTGQRLAPRRLRGKANGSFPSTEGSRSGSLSTMNPSNAVSTMANGGVGEADWEDPDPSQVVYENPDAQHAKLLLMEKIAQRT